MKALAFSAVAIVSLVGSARADRRVLDVDAKDVREIHLREHGRDDDGVYNAARDPYLLFEARPTHRSPGRRRCDDTLIDPVVTALRDGAIDAQRSACLRRELSIHLPITALIDTPGFHGEIDAALQLGGRYAVAERLELSASLRAVRYQFVQNAVNKATEAELGPLVVGVAHGKRFGASAVAIAGTLEVPATRAGTDTTHVAGAVTLLATNRLTPRTTLHSRLGFVGMRAWSLGGSTGRMALRAGGDLVRRIGERWALDLGAEIQAGWYDGFDGTTIRLGAQRRFGERVRGGLGVGLPVGGDERTNAIIDLAVIRDLD